MLAFTDLKAQFQALEPAIRERIDRVLAHGQYIMGPEVRELEERLEVLTGTEHCVTVSSGTEALLIALMSLGIGDGDEVITTSFSFAATAEVIVLAGASPVFVDIDPETCNIDAALIEAAITPRTKAIMPVSLYGQPADMTEIDAIATRHDLPVIEDAAQSFGALYQGSSSCNLSTIGCTSFFPSKPLGCYGDGGALFTNDAAVAQAAREIRVHGQSARYVHTRIGLGGRMDTLQCAIVLAKLERFEEEIRLRQAIGARYNRLFDQVGIERILQRDDRTSGFAQYTIRVNDRAAIQRELSARGIPSAIHYPVPLNEQPAYRGWASEPQPHAVTAAAQVLSLPMSADLSEADQDRVVNAVCDAVGLARRSAAA